MYNNYWNPNQSLMYPNVYPNYENNPNYIPIEDPNYRMAHPNAGPSIDPNYEMMYPNSIGDSEYQFSQNNGPGYRNERDQQTTLTAAEHLGTDLGHGFKSFSWEPVTVNPKEFFVVFLEAPGRKVISGGWKLGSPNDRVFAVESYDRKINQWVITLFNDSNRPKPVTFTLMTKN
ncbi:hypothetical protein SAMN04487767_101511 [Bacillus wiedmannii]|uniref:Uncharacterized protein n=1 Tax=Bacillus wiedmannii TaxID=1890302 RepID=A0A1G6JVZ6_9BACI|nr:hypothetical protein [Bacillus wiedmannii]MDA2379163.1 hypothetical protein [Bacillus cereus]SDC22176.1 hypothetical protein SAMN04487767_101511 [Bacillus wiedmannii]